MLLTKVPFSRSVIYILELWGIVLLFHVNLLFKIFKTTVEKNFLAISELMNKEDTRMKTVPNCSAL